MAEAWAIKWRDREGEHLVGRYAFAYAGVEPPPELEGYPSFLFKTRRAAMAAIKKHFGYIAKRPDLRREPHKWKMPVPVRVNVTISERT